MCLPSSDPSEVSKKACRECRLALISSTERWLLQPESRSWNVVRHRTAWSSKRRSGREKSAAFPPGRRGCHRHRVTRVGSDLLSKDTGRSWSPLHLSPSHPPYAAVCDRTGAIVGGS